MDAGAARTVLISKNVSKTFKFLEFFAKIGNP
jgi:hypothetical protein